MFARDYAIVAVYRNRIPAISSQVQRAIDPLVPSEQLEENRYPVFAIQADLTAPGETERVVETTLARYGRIDLLINAAARSAWGWTLESSELLKSARAQLEMNVNVPLQLAAAAARHFWRDRDQENLERNRNVVNVSSIAGMCVYPDTGQSIYSASKAALNMLTCHLADDFATFGVRVNALAPNSFPGRVRVESVASAIRQLDLCKLNGSIVAIDSDGAWSYKLDAENMQAHRRATGRVWKFGVHNRGRLRTNSR
jgi:NAD(P)-dependent dehydrogenase (short-subunit alcohol dehydrogenase family)